MKGFTILLSMILCLFILNGCSIEKTTVKVGEKERLEASLTKVKGDEYSFRYGVKNNSEKEVTLTFNTSQEFNYILWRKDAKGTRVYAYDKDKSFKKEFHKKIVKPGEELTYEIHLNQKYAPQTYVLEAYMTSNEPEQGSPSKFHQNLQFTIQEDEN